MNYDFDLIVIGGGSGGLACSQEAAKLGKKVAVVDFVKPTLQNTTWGLGGTCVNVGCIPKKLIHQASLLGEGVKDAAHFGWSPSSPITHNWEKMIEGVNNHVRSLNWGYRVALRDKNVTYINAFAKFLDPQTIECTNKSNKNVQYTAEKYVIAVGGRPKYLDIPGAKEYAITSDDLFWLANPPGKTLVIGASYVALECAGFLSGLGYDTAVMARSIFLRGFDQQMAEMIVSYMSEHGTKFIRNSTPSRIEKLENGKLNVFWKDFTSNKEVNETYDTVLMAVGRRAETDALHLERAGVVADNHDGKLQVKDEQTNIPHIYAIGDVIKGQLELTPVAIKAGRLLARRLFAGSNLKMDYENVPTTVFTPLEYGSCGLSEETAVANIGADNIEVYHTYFTPLEWTVPHREENACYIKVICNKNDNLRVVGVHVLAPNAGEITQGLGIAMKCGATKADLDKTVGIHPTIAEELTLMNITKRSGENPKKTGC